MKRQILPFALLLAVLAACAYSKDCPAQKDLLSCSCYDDVRHYQHQQTVRCKGNQIPQHQMEDFRSMLQKNFVGKTTLDLHFTFSDTPTNLSSAFFDGLPVNTLRFFEWDMLNWADEFGGKAFVGLEDSLEELEVDQSISAEKEALFTVGHLRRLKLVRFQRNRIPVLGNDWFGGNEKSTKLLYLMDVFLPKNEIAELGDRVFARVVDLHVLNLEGNEIVTVSRSMFANPAEYLREINLRDNRIKDLPEDMFENMPDLRRVNLAGNPIQYVREATWKSSWPNLDIVSFESTDLHCDDHINWMNGIQRRPRFLGKCKTPDEVAGQNLRDVLAKRRREF